MKQEKTLELHEYPNRRADWLMIIIALLMVFFRVAISSRLPAYIIGNSPHDDAWCVLRAETLLSGGWMGEYNQYTLIKGVFAPMLMAFAQRTGITYLGLNTILYCMGCAMFVAALSPVIQKRFSKLLLFAVLLFNPITYAVQTGQRIYRNGISQWQLLFIFGGIIALYIRRNEPWKKLLLWACMSGFVLWSFFNTREDGIWLWPFVLVAAAVTIASCYWQNGKKLKRRMVLFLIPLLLVLLGNSVVKMINYGVYGAPVINDRDGGAYADVVKDLYLIRPNEADEEKFESEEYKSQYYNIYTSTMGQAYQASPTLNQIREPIDAAIAMWDSWGMGGLVDGEPYADHILFALRDGVAAAGYYQSLPETEALYKKIHQELQEGFRNGSLVKRGLSFSAMAAPFQWKDLHEIISEIPNTIKCVISFADVSSAVVPARGDLTSIAMFERVSGHMPVWETEEELVVAGWAFLYSDQSDMTGGIYTAQGEKISDLAFVESPDVYQYFVEHQSAYEKAKICRFSINLQGKSMQDNLILRMEDRATGQFFEAGINQELLGQGQFFEVGCCLFDRVESRSGYAELQLQIAQTSVNRANRVIGIYQKLGTAVFVCSVGVYIFLSISLLRKRKMLAERSVAVWLLLTALLLSFLLFTACMSYMTVTTFFARMYLYLSSAYALNLMFCGIAISFALEVLYERARR